MKVCPNCKNSTMNFMKKCPTCHVEIDDSCVVGFGDALFSQVDDIRAEKAEQSTAKRTAVLNEKERVAQMDKDMVAYCPKCHSTSISANRRGWKLMTGLLGSSNVVVTCLNCGHKFKPGKK